MLGMSGMPGMTEMQVTIEMPGITGMSLMHVMLGTSR